MNDKEANDFGRRPGTFPEMINSVFNAGRESGLDECEQETQDLAQIQEVCVRHLERIKALVAERDAALYERDLWKTEALALAAILKR